MRSLWIQTSTHPVEGRCSSHRKVGLSGSMGCINMQQRRPFINLNGRSFMSTKDYVVADVNLASWGRKEIAIAETEMPGLMAIREEFARTQPLKGARHHRFAAHDHPDRRADRDAEGARRGSALASCNIFSTQDHAAAAIAAGGTPVFAVKVRR